MLRATISDTEASAVQSFVRKRVARKHCHHAHQLILNEEWIARKTNQALSHGPTLVAHARVVLHVVREVWQALLGDASNLVRTNRHPSVGSVHVRVESRARLKLEDSPIGAHGPDACECGVEMADHRCGACSQLVDHGVVARQDPAQSPHRAARAASATRSSIASLSARSFASTSSCSARCRALRMARSVLEGNRAEQLVVVGGAAHG